MTRNSARDRRSSLLRPWAIQPRLHPDIGWRDLLSALPPPSESRTDLETRIAAFAPAGTTAVVGLSVRTLFDALLAETAAGRPIVMSAVNIAGMAELARTHGCPIRPVDLDLATLAPASAAVRQAAGDGAALILLAHLYGRRLPADVFAADHQPALVVEDCAQAWDGRLSLSPGADVALFSFGPIKAATALGGGVALFRDPGLARRIAARLAAHPTLPEAWFVRRVLKYAVLRAATTPVVYGALLRLLALAGRDPDAALGGIARGFTGPIVDAVRRRPPLRLLRLLARRLANGDGPPTHEDAALAVAALAPVPGRAAAGRWWLLPVLHARPAELVAALRRRGLDATRGATSLRPLAGETGASPREASRLIGEVVYLPVPAGPAGVDRLARRLAAALEEIA